MRHRAPGASRLLIGDPAPTRRRIRRPARDCHPISGPSVRIRPTAGPRTGHHTGALAQSWGGINDRYVGATTRLSDVASSFGSVSKVLRLLLQSVMLELAPILCWLELTAGAMIAASIMMGRALAPIETAIANWRPPSAPRQSIARLSETLARAEHKRAATKPTRRSRTTFVVRISAPGE